MIDIQLEKKPLSKIQTDCLVWAGDVSAITDEAKSLPNELQNVLAGFQGLKDFSEEQNIHLLYSRSPSVPRMLIAKVGSNTAPDDLRNLGYEISQHLNKLGVKKAHLLCPPEKGSTLQLSEGIAYAGYRFDFYNSAPKKRALKILKLIGDTEKASEIKSLQNALHGVAVTRDLGNEPSNKLTPELLVKRAKSLFKKSSVIEVSSLDENALKKQKMYSLLSVAAGSKEKPYLLIMHYKPPKAKGRVCLVGKGVTFDSGGISIKPSAGMEEMKYDMCGAAAVVGTMAAIEGLKPELEVVALVPTVENMPGGSAYKPGDVVTSMSGKTVEVINTDAEGRMILIDALSYAQKHYKPDCIIDFATLTGACHIALGDKTAGLFCNNSTLEKVLKDAGEEPDRVWPLPLYDSYARQLESDVADIKHIGSRYGGAITAAKFLQAFVEDVPWAHLDIAGVAYNVTHVPYLGKGASGFGPRLMLKVLEMLQDNIKVLKK